MENNFTPEQIEKAKAARSPEELLSLAKESGVEMTEEQANAYFEKLHKSGELSDDELDNVAGGGCSGPKPSNTIDPNGTCPNWRCKKCDKDKNAIGSMHRHGALYIRGTCQYCKSYYFDGSYHRCRHPSKN